jgi:hypothetical protein
MLYKDDAPSVEVGVLVAAPFEPVGRAVRAAGRERRDGGPPRRLRGAG